jgi:hypothetical protein
MFSGSLQCGYRAKDVYCAEILSKPADGDLEHAFARSGCASVTWLAIIPTIMHILWPVTHHKPVKRLCWRDTMADILPFKRPTAADLAKGKTLCRNGHHQWRVWQNKQFDVQAGKLVTVYRCKRCNKQKVKAH